MGFNSAFKGLKLKKKPGNGRLNNLNDPVLNVLIRCLYTQNKITRKSGIVTDTDKRISRVRCGQQNGKTRWGVLQHY